MDGQLIGGNIDVNGESEYQSRRETRTESIERTLNNEIIECTILRLNFYRVGDKRVIKSRFSVFLPPPSRFL